MLNKICGKCGITKTLNMFNKAKNGKYGFYSICKDCRKIYSIENKKIIQNYKKKYFKKNKENINIKRNIRRRRKLLTDPAYKLKHLLRVRIRTAISRNYKKGSSIDLLGCSIQEYKLHLEKQFKPGMSWGNHGNNGWHIDHIRPCASFDLSKEKEQLKCFNYKNTQPLWATENLIKGDKYETN